jgi:hypothetical protein
MKLVSLGLVAALFAGCDSAPSKLEGKVTAPSADKAAGGGHKAELIARIQRLDERVKAFEALHTPNPGAGSLMERLHRVEVGLGRREEALGFLEMAYQQQKRQQEAQEAQEPDPNAVFAVDISKALANGQVEGPNSAIVTIVEAWDFA